MTDSLTPESWRGFPAGVAAAPLDVPTQEVDEVEEAAYRAALDVATAALAAYDGGTASHSDDVVTLCLALCEELGVRGRDRAYLLAAAELHDIGKVGVSADVLRKPAPLDAGEWQAMREHTVTGQRILGAVPELAEVALIVRHCHERWDGGGYPDGLRGQRIPLAARIVFCADAFHAIRCSRPYRSGRSAREALDEVTAHSGTQFDPRVVAALAKVTERLRQHRAPPGWLIQSKRSQRLAALLLALAVGGSSFAATGGFKHLPGGGKASEPPSRGAGCVQSSCLDDSGARGTARKPTTARSLRAALSAGGPTASRGRGRRFGSRGSAESIDPRVGQPALPDGPGGRDDREAGGTVGVEGAEQRPTGSGDKEAEPPVTAPVAPTIAGPQVTPPADTGLRLPDLSAAEDIALPGLPALPIAPPAELPELPALLRSGLQG